MNGGSILEEDNIIFTAFSLLYEIDQEVLECDCNKNLEPNEFNL